MAFPLSLILPLALILSHEKQSLVLGFNQKVSRFESLRSRFLFT